MKKFLLILTVIMFGALCNSAFAVPEMRPAAPDVPSNSSLDDYKPGVINQNSSTTQNGFKQDDFTDDEMEVLEEDEYNPITGEGSFKDDAEDVANEVKETVNEVKDAASDAVKSAKEKVKKEKEKKVKDPYKGYKDAANDDYIKSLDEETSSDEPVPAKTYSQDDYEQAYRDMEVPTFTFVHGVDPDQYYDMKDTMWSPYPLFRLNSPLYFKTITIEPGYYLLTPREYKGNWYVLFKESGVVKYTIPVFAKDYTPEFYYKDTLPELDMNRSQRWQIKFLNAWGKYVRKSKRKPPVNCNIELTDLDNNFLLIELYYGPHKYSTIYRVEKF